MRTVFKSSFFWQFSGGFVLGAIGLLTLQPAEATRNLTHHFAHTQQVER